METISIKDFHRGQSSSRYLGDGAVARSVNLDVFSIPGIAKVNPKMTWRSSSASFAGTPLWQVRNPNATSDIYALDSSHYIAKSGDSGDTWAGLSHSGNDTDGNAPSVGVGNGLIIWKKYVVEIGNTTMDFYGLTGSGFAGLWKNRRVLTLSNSFKWHTAFVSRNDGCLYVGDKNILHKIKEVVGKTFDPTDNTTYDVSVSVTLPDDYQIRCIEEKGLTIWAGTYKGSSIYDFQDAAFFPWDRNSTNYDQPIFVPEAGVHAMKNKAGRLYCLVGIYVKLYELTEGGLTYLDRLPGDFTDGNFCEVLPGAIDILKGNLAFGVSAGTSGPGADAPLYGVYSWNNKFVLEHIISTGNTARVTIGSILNISSNSLSIGWTDTDFVTTNYGMDKTDTTKYASYVAYFESIFYRIGTKYKRGTIKSFEIILAKLFPSGGGIKIKYRRGAGDSWITLVTLTQNNFATAYSLLKNQTISSENIQIRIELIGDVELLEVRANP